MEKVQLTPELIYQYKVPEKSLTDVLQADMEALKDMSQPSLVNDQLNQLYCDLELEGLDTTLKLEDDIDYDGSFSDIINGGKQTLFHRYNSQYILYLLFRYRSVSVFEHLSSEYNLNK